MPVLKNLHCQTFHTSIITSSSFSTKKSPPNAFNLWKTIHLKYCPFWSLHQNPESPKIPTKAIDIDSSLLSNSCFSVTTSLISSIKVSIEKFTLVPEESIGRSFILIPAKNPDSPKNSINFDSSRYSNC